MRTGRGGKGASMSRRPGPATASLMSSPCRKPPHARDETNGVRDFGHHPTINHYNSPPYYGDDNRAQLCKCQIPQHYYFFKKKEKEKNRYKMYFRK